MQFQYRAIFVSLYTICSGCAPEAKCGDNLYYHAASVSCRPCPKNSVFKSGTCDCKDPYEFADAKCVLPDGVLPEIPDAAVGDEAGAAKPDCMNYCQFVKVCIADNPLAGLALADVISGLKADDSAACATGCERDIGGDGTEDPAVACIEAGREETACAGDTTQVGVMSAIGLIGDCCRTRTDNGLCKSICETLKINPLLMGGIDFCK